jgi:hypothetical protein
MFRNKFVDFFVVLQSQKLSKEKTLKIRYEKSYFLRFLIFNNKYDSKIMCRSKSNQNTILLIYDVRAEGANPNTSKTPPSHS